MTDDGTEAFKRAAKALNEAGDRELRKGVYKGFRATATPLGRRMVDGLADDMPKRGGLSARVRSSKVSIRNATTGSNPRVVISLGGPAGAQNLRGMDRGNVRHPLYGNRKVWRNQSVPANGATRAFEAGAPLVRAAVIRELEQVMTDTARKGSG